MPAPRPFRSLTPPSGASPPPGCGEEQARVRGSGGAPGSAPIRFVNRAAPRATPSRTPRGRLHGGVFAAALLSLLLLPMGSGAAGEAGAGVVPASASALPPASPPGIRQELAVGRLRYGGGGDWYANPTALPNLARAIREQTGIPVATREVVVTPTDPALRDLLFVHLTGHGELRFAAEERAALREWMRDGGFLHVDDNYGLDPAFRREVALLFPEAELVELPPDHPVYHTVHPFPEGLPKIHEHDGLPPRGYGVHLDGRLVLFYSHETDLGNGWEDREVHDLPAELREAALAMGVNLFVYALSRRVP